jgi:hypothetical protein
MSQAKQFFHNIIYSTLQWGQQALISGNISLDLKVGSSHVSVPIMISGSVDSMIVSRSFPFFLKHHPKDPHGGVLIVAKKQLQLGNITKSKDIELITGSVSLEGKKKK